MKYITLFLIIAVLSCNKNKDDKPKYDPPPTVTDIQISTETIGAVTHPKFTVTLTIPDTAATRQFMLFFKTSNIPMVLQNPKSGTYTFTDIYNGYPLQPGKNIYTSAFIMADNSAIYNSEFTIN